MADQDLDIDDLMKRQALRRTEREGYFNALVDMAKTDQEKLQLQYYKSLMDAYYDTNLGFYALYKVIQKLDEKIEGIKKDHDEVSKGIETMASNITDFIKMKDKLKKLIDDFEQREKLR